MEAQRFEFDESQHPRDEAGRFTDAEGGERVIPSREDSTRSLSPEAHGWLYHYQWGDLGVNAAEVRNPVPSDKVIRELAPYVGKADAKVLYRAEYTDVPRDPNQQITSWSRYENDVRRIVEGNERPMRIVHEVIPRERIIVDTTRLPGAYRREHDANQNEVIVAHGKLAERLLRVRGQKFAAAKPSVSVSLAEEAPAIHDDLASIFEEAYRTAGVNVSRLRGVGVALTNAKQHAEAYARARAGDLITDIDETTQERVQRVIGNAMRDGTSETEVSDKLAGLFGEQRADLIARTETATAFNLGTVQALKDAGEEYVFVTDGDQYDEECVNADGEIWTLEEAEANPLEHPNCQRDFRPLTEDELAEVKAEEEADEAEGFAARVAARQEARLRRAEFYSEDQPRDENGRWTDGGGGEAKPSESVKSAPFVRMKDLPPELQKIRREQNAARSKAFKEREKARREAEKLKPPPPPPPPPPEPPQPRPEPPEPKQPEPVPPTPKEPEGKEGWRPKEVEGPTGSPRQIEDRATGLYVHVEKAPEGSTTTFVPPGPNSENGHLQLARDEKGFTITLALRPGDETPLYTRYREWTEKQRYREYMRSVQVAYAEKKAERQRLRDAAAAARGPSSPKLPTGSDRKEQRTAEYFRNLLAAGMPPEHLDGLGEIRLDTPGINRLTGEKEGGHYSAGRSEIVISNEMRHGAEWGLAHEIGHHVHLTRLTAAAADEWARISYSGGSCRMSNYGKQNTGEHFAEAYKAYFGAQEWVSNRLNQTSISKYDIGVDFNREKLRLEEPKAFAFMERLAKKDSGMLLPIGRRFPVHLQDTRYLQKFHEKSPNRQDRSYRPLTGRTRRRRS